LQKYSRLRSLQLGFHHLLDGAVERARHGPFREVAFQFPQIGNLADVIADTVLVLVRGWTTGMPQGGSTSRGIDFEIQERNIFRTVMRRLSCTVYHQVEFLGPK